MDTNISAPGVSALMYLCMWYYVTMQRAVREAATICPRPLQVNLPPFDLESGVRVTCDVTYLCANFSLPDSSRLRIIA